MPLINDIKVNIADGGLGRPASGKDWYSGLIFQSATTPAGMAADVPMRISTLKDAISKGITEALFPVAYYQLEEFFRVSEKTGLSAWISVMFSNILTGAFVGAEIEVMQNAENGELRQIGVFLIDAYADTFVSGANTIAETLNEQGFPVSVYIACDIADYTALTDLRTLDAKWVSVIISQDGGGKGAALAVSQGYSIATIGAVLAITGSAAVHERTGYVAKFDASGTTELQTLAVADGTLVSIISDTDIDALNTKGYTLMVKRRVAGSYIYTDCVTASALTSDFTEQRFNRTIGKGKRLLLQYLAPLQNAPLYVNPDTGKMSEKTLGVFQTICEEALNQLAINQEISFDVKSGRIPKNSITIDPDQNVLTTNKIIIGAKIVPVGAAGTIEVNLSFSTSIG